METNEIVQAIDEEISKLQQARAIIAGTVAVNPTAPAAKRRGRPKGSGVKAATEVAAIVVPANAPRKTMTAAGKARIAAAQAARWAAKRKADAAAERAAKRASAEPVKTVRKVASKQPAKPAAKTSSPKKSTTVKKAVKPQAEMAAATA